MFSPSQKTLPSRTSMALDTLWQWLAWRCVPPRGLDRVARHETRGCLKVVRVSDVYDGDTFTVVARIDGTWQRRRCRCAGYDAPELRSANPREKKQAIAARDFLKATLPSGAFTLRVEKLDKYGRWLVRVPGRPLDKIMVETGHGVPYDGGTKPAFRDSLLCQKSAT